MRLGIIKNSKYEVAFFNMTIFKNDEDLIIFPYEEFLKTYDKISSNLHIAGKVVKEVLADLSDDPRRDFVIVGHYIDRVEEDNILFLKFEPLLNPLKNKMKKK